MGAPTYEYRDGSLWIRLQGLGNPPEIHAELIEVLTRVLEKEQGDEEGRFRAGYTTCLHWLLLALVPTRTHLAGGWEDEAARQANDLPAPQESNSDEETD